MARAVEAIQIHTDDQAATGEFFRTVLGWEFEPFPPMPWTARTTVAGTVLGLAPVHDVNRPGDVVLGVRSDDVDGDVAAARAAGGELLAGPAPVPDGGRFAICVAPGGSKVLFYEEQRA